MNILRKIYPLWLRQKFYFQIVARANLKPEARDGFELEFAPHRMRALLSTDYGHKQIAWLGYYELTLSRRIAALAKEGGVMIDVGANAGYFTCMWAALNLRNRVLAFEPSPRNLAMVRQNVGALQAPARVTVYDVALGRAAGAFNFDLGPEEESGWGGLVNSVSARSIQVQVKRLDDLVPDGESVSVLKIDTEGADTWVLLGAEKLLREKRIKHVFYEENVERMNILGIRQGQAEEFLTHLNYKVCPIGFQEFYAVTK